MIHNDTKISPIQMKFSFIKSNYSTINTVMAIIIIIIIINYITEQNTVKAADAHHNIFKIFAIKFTLIFTPSATEKYRYS